MTEKIKKNIGSWVIPIVLSTIAIFIGTILCGIDIITAIFGWVGCTIFGRFLFSYMIARGKEYERNLLK